MVSTAGIMKTSASRTGNLLKWIWKNKWIILLIFAYIPVFITAFHTAQETNNWSYIPVSAGLSTINADSQLAEKVYILENNPGELIGMEKPEKGIWQKLKYFFKTTRVVWLLLALVSMITLPFIFFIWLFKKGNESTKIRATILGIITTLVFLLIVNLIIINVSGNPLYKLNPTLDFYAKAKQTINNAFPLHGFVSLIKYLVALF